MNWGGVGVPYTCHGSAEFAFLEVSARGKRNVAHVAQPRTGFEMIFARKRRSIRRLDFQTPNLRSRGSGVRISPGAPLYSKQIKRLAFQPLFLFSLIF